MATVPATAAGTNTGSAWRTEQHSAVTDKTLSEFSLERYNMLMTNTLRVNQLAYETVSTAENLAPTLARLETSEANDLLFITQSIMTVRSNCEELKCTAVSTDWPPVTLVAGSMTDGLYGLRYTIPSPGSPCNSFALTTLHCRRCRNWISLKSAETLFPSCRLPHYSYTHAEFNCFRRCGPDTVEILTGTAFSYHWANCPGYVYCYDTEYCHGDFEHWGDPNLTVHKWTSELLVHSPFSTVACLSDALDWHHSSTGRADGCHLLQSITSPFSDNCDSPPADDKFCRRVSHCRSTDCFQQAVL